MPFVEPPVAAIPTIAFRSARRSRNVRAVGPEPASCAASVPARVAASSFAARSSAGMSPSPIRAMPRQSSATAIVLAVKWPAHVPAPGQATRSSSSSSARGISPRSSAPTASQTSWIVTSSPSQPAGAHRAAVEHDRGLVDARERHQRGGDGLVAADDADQGVEVVRVHHQLDRVGDHLARDQRRAHPRRPLRLVVGDGDRVEPERHAACGADALADARRQLELVEVARHRLRPGRDDADDRTVQSGRVDAHCAKVCARRRALSA